MGFQVSPGVVVTEKDLTTIVPAVSTTDGAYAGVFRWGPLNHIVLVGDELQLAKRFGKPVHDKTSEESLAGSNAVASSFFTCANFLSYGDKLRIVRIAGDDARNATSGKGNNDGVGVLIENDDDYEKNHSNGIEDKGVFAARYPGELGNSIKISVCASEKSFSQTVVGTVSGSKGQKVLTGAGTDFTKQITKGTIIKHSASKQEIKVAEVTGADTLVLEENLNTALSGATVIAKWEFADVIGFAPTTSTAVKAGGGSGDELHVVVVDVDGKISGSAGTILERYSLLSKASDAMKEDGSTNYYVNVINRTSQYVRWLDHVYTTENWGSKVEAGEAFFPTSSDTEHVPHTKVMKGGVDSNNSDTDDTILGNRVEGYELFANGELVDVSLVLMGEAPASLCNIVVSNVCESRKDCVAFISPPKDAVVGNPGNERDQVLSFRNSDLNISSSYAVMDSGWKMQYDKYNDVYRWVPLNGDIAGLCVRTDVNQDPWWSPAGYNRGQIKNVVKLAWNPFKAERDDLYLAGVNPVMATQGQGTILFGDKTMLAKPSAFDRINVRRLFIVLEKAIARASKFMLFEFNDEFTRQQFRSLVEPFLRDVQARRGIYDFKVVCDRTNNSAEVIDRNEFVGDIYIKPARAINFIQLNFIAVRTGVDFSEIVGKA